MSNWCMTTIKIYNENKVKLEELEKSLNKWTSKNYMDNDFGKNWLGNIVIGAGLGIVSQDKKELITNLDCYGSLCYMELDENCLWIETETAWKPMFQLWLKLLEKYLPDGEIIYYAKEIGNAIYCSNDTQYKDLYCVQFEDIDNISKIIGYDIEDFMDTNEISKMDLRKCLQLLLDTDEYDMDTLIELTTTKYDEDDIYILKCKYIEPKELD